MVFKDKSYRCLIALIISSVLVISAGQNYNEIESRHEVKRITWCTVSRAEQRKCENFASAVERDRIKIGYDVYKVRCKQAFSKEECMVLLDEERVTLTSLDAGEVFTGGRFHSLVPIAQEVTESGLTYYYSVAVIKKNSLGDVSSLHDLRGKKACFAGVGTMAGWVLPVYTLMTQGGMEIIDCNNHVKTTTHFFGRSCAVNALIDKNNPIGDNSDKLCQLCVGKIPGGKCTDADPYAGYEGAFRCLLEAGEIAFLKHTTVEEVIIGSGLSGLSKDVFELLCKDGTRKPMDQYQSCNWGEIPTNAIVASSATSHEERTKYQKFLQKVAELYSNGSANVNQGNNNNNNYNGQPEYDQFGTRIRYKRQSFGDFGNRNTNNNQYGVGDRSQYDQYGRNAQAGQSDPNNPNPPLNANQSPYGNDFNRDQYGQGGAPGSPNREGNFPYNRDGSQDPFSRDPYNINRDRYGVNIDPYGTERRPYDRDQYDRDHFDDDDDRYNQDARGNHTLYEVFNLFESTPRYGTHGNLLFQDSTRRFKPLPESQQTYTGYLGRLVGVVMGIRQCPVNRMTLCVTSDYELEKCVKMRTALKAQLLKPEMSCYKGHSQINCMQAIRNGAADVAVFDAGDVYTSGVNFELIPFISEVYNLGDPEYYVVAVAKEADPDTDLTYLRGKYTCHGGINTGAGWVYPMAYLVSNDWIRPYGCDSMRAAAEYFSKSCVPGALSTEYNTGVPYDNMCDLCHGSSFRYCRRDASEVYYGHTGALRCLVEGGGHVAFVKHTTVLENTGGKRREWWARDALMDDFELLCPDGTRAEVNEYLKCNLGKVKANAVVTRGGYGYNETQINAYINLFLYAQTFYGRKIPDEFSFSMFYSIPPHTDLIFQDAATQLKVIEPGMRYYSSYLGSDFMRAKRIVDCHAGAYSVHTSLLTVIVSTLFTFLMFRY